MSSNVVALVKPHCTDQFENNDSDDGKSDILNTPSSKKVWKIIPLNPIILRIKNHCCYRKECDRLKMVEQIHWTLEP